MQILEFFLIMIEFEVGFEIYINCVLFVFSFVVINVV